MASLTLSLHLLDALGHTGTPLGHNLRILLGALVLLIAVQQVGRGRGEELHAAPGRGGVAVAGPPLSLVLADDTGCPPGGWGRLAAAHLAAAPPQ